MKMHNGTEDTAGPKAPNDIYKFTEQLGGKSIEFKIAPNISAPCKRYENC